MDFSEHRELEIRLMTLARSRGYNGSPFTDCSLLVGTTPEHEWQIVYLNRDLRPRPATTEAKEQVREWARNIVLSSKPITATNFPATTGSKLARERRRAGR